MIIIAGSLHVAPADRDHYLHVTDGVARLARRTPGCHDFVQAADPIDAGRINIYERWESDDALTRFRDSDGPEPPPILSADVHKYRISSIESP